MEYFVGLDVTLRSCALCLVDGKGTVLLKRDADHGASQIKSSGMRLKRDPDKGQDAGRKKQNELDPNTQFKGQTSIQDLFKEDQTR
jgi:hypothetical protein